MDVSDEYCSTESDCSATESTQNGRSSTVEPSLRRSPRESVRNKKKIATLAQARMPKNLRTVNAMKKHITKLLRGHDIDYNLSVRVLGAALELQGSYLQTLSKARKEKKKSIPAPKIRETVCKQFHISTATFSKIHHEYFAHRRIYISGKNSTGRTGNTMPKETRIPRTKALLIEVRTFVRSRRLRKERVTCRQVLDFFIQNNQLLIPRDATGQFIRKDFNSAYRSVHRWVKDFAGYNQGKRKGNLVPSAENVAKKHYYLRKLFENANQPAEARKREVYTDESYIHEHYHRNDDSIWDPNDEQDLQTSKDKHKGRRYCFCAAIQGPNPRVANPSLDCDKAGVVRESLWIFCPKKKQIIKVTIIRRSMVTTIYNGGQTNCFLISQNHQLLFLTMQSTI